VTSRCGRAEGSGQFHEQAAGRAGAQAWDLLIGVRGGPLFLPTAAGTGGTSLFHVFGYVGLFFSLVLILRVIIAITREGI
jgi:hypothetical protein